MLIISLEILYGYNSLKKKKNNLKYIIHFKEGQGRVDDDEQISIPSTSVCQMKKNSRFLEDNQQLSEELTANTLDMSQFYLKGKVEKIFFFIDTKNYQ